MKSLRWKALMSSFAIWFVLFASATSIATSIEASCNKEEKLIDTNYIGVCSYTSSQSFTLSRDSFITRIRVWYNSNIGDNNYVLKDSKGNIIYTSLKSGGCQYNWCERYLFVDKILSQGTYYVVGNSSNICSDPSGKTTLMVFGCALTSEVPSAMVVSCDLNGDGKHDIIHKDAQGNMRYSTSLTSWTNLPGKLEKYIACGDLNGDKKDDIIGTNSSNQIYYTLNLGSSWQNVPGALSKIFISDYNGDGRADILGLNQANNIYVSYNLSTFSQIPGSLVDITPGNFNINRAGNEFAGINSAGQIYYTNDFYNFIPVPGELAKVFSGEINGDGRADLMGLNSKNQIYYSTDLRTWTFIPGALAYIATGDLDGNGINDLVGFNSNGDIYYTLNRSSWANIPGKLNNLITADVNGDKRADVIGIGGDGQVYYTTNLKDWSIVGGGGSQPPGIKQTIGPEGGTISYQGITIRVPQGAFSTAIDIEVAKIAEPSGDDELSPLYQITGIPSSINSDISVEIQIPGTSRLNTSNNEIIIYTGEKDLIFVYRPQKGFSFSRATTLDAQTAINYIPVATNTIKTYITDKISDVKLWIQARKTYTAETEHFIGIGKNRDKTTIDSDLVTLESIFNRLQNIYKLNWEIGGGCRFSKNPPNKIYVYFSDMGPEKPPGEFVSLGDALWLDICKSNWFYLNINTNPDVNALKESTLAHELFHFLQAIYLRNSKGMYDWLWEASSMWLETEYKNCPKFMSESYAFSYNGLFNASNTAVKNEQQQIPSTQKLKHRWQGYGAANFLLYLKYTSPSFSISKMWDSLRSDQGEYESLQNSIGDVSGALLKQKWKDYSIDTFTGESRRKFTECFFGNIAYRKELKISSESSFPINYADDVYEFSAFMDNLVLKTFSPTETFDLPIFVKGLLDSQTLNIYAINSNAPPTYLGELSKNKTELWLSNFSQYKGRQSPIGLIFTDTNFTGGKNPSYVKQGPTNKVDVTLGLGIKSITPSSGKVNDSVEIYGFFPSGKRTKVFFNGVEASFNRVGVNKLIATVPSGATSGDVIVEIEGIKSNPKFFTLQSVPTPIIHTLSPSSGVAGETLTLTLTGSNFGTNTDKRQVNFGTTVITNVNWSTDGSSASFKVQIPSNAKVGDSYNVSVEVNGNKSNNVSFYITEKGCPPIRPCPPGTTPSGLVVDEEGCIQISCKVIK